MYFVLGPHIIDKWPCWALQKLIDITGLYYREAEGIIMFSNFIMLYLPRIYSLWCKGVAKNVKYMILTILTGVKAF